MSILLRMSIFVLVLCAMTVGPLFASASLCPILTRNLARGSPGSDVRALQQFLAQDTAIYPEALITGYFGTMTERALQRWQARQGIVTSGSPLTTGWGVVGPKTRTLIKKCQNTGTTPNLPFRATPPNGSAPLNVVFGITAKGEKFSIDYGDGQSEPVGRLCPEHSGSQCHLYAEHWYVAAGSYVAGLYECVTGLIRLHCRENPVATTTIIVSDVPIIVFTSPTAGQNFTQGGYLEFTWTWEARQGYALFGYALFELVSIDNGKVFKLSTVPINYGSNTSYIETPEDFATNPGGTDSYFPPGRYKIRASIPLCSGASCKSGGPFFESEVFTITQ